MSTSRTEAIYSEIIVPLSTDPEVDAREDAEAQIRRDYDVDAIADRVLGGYDTGYAVIVDEATFWEVAAAARI